MNTDHANLPQKTILQVNTNPTEPIHTHTRPIVAARLLFIINEYLITHLPVWHDFNIY